ncbi:MAG TPA: hypothetical protein QGF58_09720 [Myxococcota bacterium]|nr:hypothetical protein [Myxococcota bacterium]
MYVVLLLSCTEPGDLDYTLPPEEEDDSSVAESAPPDSDDLGDPCAYEAGVQKGTVESAELGEISGLAPMQDYVWVHNDSDNEGLMYAMEVDGSHVGTAWIEDYLLIDPEDSARGDGKLYLGDIGDNGENREFIRVFRFPEPEPDFAVGQLESFHITYPDGPHDAEAMAVDKDGSLFIITKSASGDSGIYKLAAPLTDGELEKVGSLTVGSGDLPGGTGVTSADADDTRVVLRTYTHLFLWPRLGRTLDEAISTPPACSIDIESEPQGEAVALNKAGFLTVSEGENQPIWFYKKSD